MTNRNTNKDAIQPREGREREDDETQCNTIHKHMAQIQKDLLTFGGGGGGEEDGDHNDRTKAWIHWILEW